jgi:hypothetical protein
MGVARPLPALQDAVEGSRPHKGVEYGDSVPKSVLATRLRLKDHERAVSVSIIWSHYIFEH